MSDLLSPQDIDLLLEQTRLKAYQPAPKPIRPSPPSYSDTDLHAFVLVDGFTAPPPHKMASLKIDAYQTSTINEKLQSISKQSDPAELLVFDTYRLLNKSSNVEAKLFFDLDQQQGLIHVTRKHLAYKPGLRLDSSEAEFGATLSNATRIHQRTKLAFRYDFLNARITLPSLSIRGKSGQFEIKQGFQVGDKAQSIGKASYQLYLSKSCSAFMYIKKFSSLYKGCKTPLPQTVLGLSILKQSKGLSVGANLIVSKDWTKHLVRLSMQHNSVLFQSQNVLLQSEMRGYANFGTFWDQRLLAKPKFLRGQQIKGQPLAGDIVLKAVTGILPNVKGFVLARMYGTQTHIQPMFGWGIRLANLELWFVQLRNGLHWGMKVG